MAITKVTNRVLENNSVGVAQLAAGAVTPAKLSAGGLTWDASGNVGIGTTAPSRKLDVIGEIRSTGANIMNYNAPTLFFQDTDNRSGMIHVNGNVMHFLRGTGNNSLDWTSLSNGQWPLLVSLENGDNYIGGNCFIQNGLVSLRNTAGTYRYIQYLTAAADRSAVTARFDVGITDGAETGSNAGSDYFIHRFSDNGSYLGRPLFINRANGNVTLENNLVVTGNATVATPTASTHAATKGYVDGQSLLNTNGYRIMPGGFIMQWGNTGTSGYFNSPGKRLLVNFPIPFPNACLNVQGTAYVYNVGTYVAVPEIYLLSNTQVGWQDGDNDNTPWDIYWLAIGY